MSRERADDQAYLLNSRGTERFCTPHFSPRPADPVAPVIRKAQRDNKIVEWVLIGIVCAVLLGFGFVAASVRW